MKKQVALLLLVFISVVLHGQEDKKTKEIRKIIELSNGKENVINLLVNLNGKSIDHSKNWSEIEKLMLFEIDSLIEKLVIVYHENFTYQQLKDISRHYKKEKELDDFTKQKIIETLLQFMKISSDWGGEIALRVIENNKSAARKIYENNEASIALTKLDSLIQIDSKDFSAYAYKGKCLHNLGHFHDAISLVEKALTLNYKYTEGYYFKFLMYSLQSKFTLAKPAIETAIKLEPENLDYLIAAGGLYVRTGELEKGISCYTSVVEKAPYDYESFYARATAYKWKDQWDNAEADYNHALYLIDLKLKEDSQNLEALSIKGTILGDLNQYTKALLCFEKILNIDPYNGNAYAIRAATYLEIKDYKKALNDFQYLIDNNIAMTGDYNNRGYCLLKLGNFEKALQDFNYVIENMPSHSYAYSNRGFIKMKNKDFDGAKKDIDYSIKLLPSNVFALKNLGLLYIEQDQKNEGCEIFQNCLKGGFTEKFGNEVLDLIDKHCK